MSPIKQHTASPSRKLTFISLVVFLFVLNISSFSQNTKGDQPSKPSRETRFKSKPSKSKSKGIGKRVSPQGKSRAASATKRGEKAGRPVNPIYRAKSPQGKERAWKGDITGRRIPATRSQSNEARNVYPQSGKYMGRKGPSDKDPQLKWRAVERQRVQVRSATGKTRNVYPQFNKYVNNPSRKPRPIERPTSNAPQLAKLKKMGSQPQPPDRKRVVPATASRPYISRKSINPYAGFWNRKQKGERPYTRDISGRRLRTINYQTPPQKVLRPTTSPYYGRKGAGDRPYKGPAAGSYRTTTSASRAWKGDISGRRIRGRNFSSKPGTEGGVMLSRKRKAGYGDKPFKGMMPGGGYQSATQSGEKRTGKAPLPGRAPGIGAKGIDTYQGNIRFGKSFDTQGAGYSGNMKARKPLKGGGSVSGKLWNNQGRAITGRYPGKGAEQAATYQGNIRFRKGFDDVGSDYTGNIKARKPMKGGGSVSGKLWNNKGQPVLGRAPGRSDEQMATYQGNIRFRKSFDDVGADYTGNIKARKPVKGGGSVSGKLWNNKEQPIQGRPPGKEDERMAAFSGNLKGKAPQKGGGSISGKLWNNKEQPLPGRYPPGRNDERMAAFGGTVKVKKKEPGKDIGGFPGKIMEFDLHPDMRDQGETFTGYTRLSRFKKNYVRNPNADELALKKKRPGESTYKIDGLQVKVKEKDYDKKPHAADGSLPGISPSKSSIKASEYARGIKMDWRYVRNPSSDEDALKVREPGKAFAKVTDYQGNIKMKKYELFARKKLHPDAQFVKTNQNNVKEEKNMLTNFKLFWARLFKKSDTQPEHLKEKIQKPRYDKREQGLWYD
ncbi:MAG TPA: hypothetical protein PLV21_11965 [Cyclobacteriaceae bacterium]|nr:hypothetical protein [Cyclobacteriaceae bacterium]HRJ82596.1 hypothetical protein [Cyclobacteriaceae bacterium]